MNFFREHKIAFPIIILILIVSSFYFYKPTKGLDAFVTLTQQDPLFYSSYFDTNAFSEAVTELKVSEQQLKKTALHNISLTNQNYKNTYTELISNTQLFPTDFLALLPEISERTNNFNSQPTKQKAYALLKLYEQAQHTYERDSRSMLESFNTIEEYTPDDRPTYYFFINSGTSVKLAQNNFDLIYKNSFELKKEIDRRYECLKENINCDIKTISQEQEFNTLSSQVINFSGVNANFIRETLPFASSTTREIHGPYQVSSACWGKNNSNLMYAIYSTNDKGQKMILPKLVNENYYNIVSPKASDKISQSIKALGLEFYGQAEGTTYECSDLNFYPDILTQDYIHSNDISTSTNNIVYTNFINNKFGVLAPALQSLASFTNLLETSQRISTDFVLSPQFLFTTRSAYSLTYLTFAQSVWRIDEQPQFLLSTEEFKRLGSPTQYKSLTELKNKGISDADIKKSHINQKEFIESLVK